MYIIYLLCNIIYLECVQYNLKYLLYVFARSN